MCFIIKPPITLEAPITLKCLYFLLFRKICGAQRSKAMIWILFKVSEREQHANTWRHSSIETQLIIVFNMILDFLTHEWSLSQSIAVGVFGLNWKINIHYLLYRLPCIFHWYRLSQKRKARPPKQVQSRKTDEHMAAGKTHCTICSWSSCTSTNTWNVRGWRETYGEML